jgi:hypothetical protein
MVRINLSSLARAIRTEKTKAERFAADGDGEFPLPADPEARQRALDSMAELTALCASLPLIERSNGRFPRYRVPVSNSSTWPIEDQINDTVAELFSGYPYSRKPEVTESNWPFPNRGD